MRPLRLRLVAHPGELDTEPAKDGSVDGLSLETAPEIGLRLGWTPLGENATELGDVSITEGDEAALDPVCECKSSGKTSLAISSYIFPNTFPGSIIATEAGVKSR